MRKRGSIFKENLHMPYLNCSIAEEGNDYDENEK
jgi:hypothetical protein